MYPAIAVLSWRLRALGKSDTNTQRYQSQQYQSCD
jgi:hypothetical protein